MRLFRISISAFLALTASVLFASGSESIGPHTITATPVEATVVFGSVPAADWLNIDNSAVTVTEAFTGPGIVERGFANVPRVNTSDVHIEMRFSPALVNGPGAELLIVAAQFSATAYGLRSAHNNFSTQLYVSSTLFQDTQENGLYYYGQTVGPYAADVYTTAVDLSSMGIPDCAEVDTFRLVLFEGSEADLLGMGALAPTVGPVLTATPQSVSVGQNLDLTTCGGVPSNLALLFLTGVNGTPIFVSSGVFGLFDSQGRWSLAGPVPPDPTLAGGVDLTLRTLTLDEVGLLIQSNDETVSFVPVP
jgi:hypothetical protein